MVPRDARNTRSDAAAAVPPGAEGALDTSAFEPGRTAAAVLVAEAYEAAFNALHPDDVDERAWYRARLIDARVIAGLAPVEQ